MQYQPTFEFAPHFICTELHCGSVPQQGGEGEASLMVTTIKTKFQRE